MLLSSRLSLSLSLLQCLSVRLCPSFLLSVCPTFSCRLNGTMLTWLLPRQTANQIERGGPLAVRIFCGHSLPRIKGWELICKPAKPETMLGFPFCSFDTDLNMCTKFKNKIYIKVEIHFLTQRCSALHCLRWICISQVVNLIFS